MTKNTITWEEAIAKFDEFEEKFSSDYKDESLLTFFEDFSETVLNSGFSKDQLMEVRDRMKKLQDIFADKKTELKELSTQAIDRSENVSQYIKNANYKK